MDLLKVVWAHQNKLGVSFGDIKRGCASFRFFFLFGVLNVQLNSLIQDLDWLNKGGSCCYGFHHENLWNPQDWNRLALFGQVTDWERCLSMYCNVMSKCNVIFAVFHILPGQAWLCHLSCYGKLTDHPPYLSCVVFSMFGLVFDPIYLDDYFLPGFLSRATLV